MEECAQQSCLISLVCSGNPLQLLLFCQCSSWNIQVFGGDHRWYQICLLGFSKKKKKQNEQQPTTKNKSQQKRAILLVKTKPQIPSWCRRLGMESASFSVNKPSKPHFIQTSGVWWVAPSSKYWQISKDAENSQSVACYEALSASPAERDGYPLVGVLCLLSVLSTCLDWNQVSRLKPGFYFLGTHVSGMVSKLQLPG